MPTHNIHNVLTLQYVFLATTQLLCIHYLHSLMFYLSICLDAPQPLLEVLLLKCCYPKVNPHLSVDKAKTVIQKFGATKC